ncbi:MAG: PCRF domain-containing protein, partial [Verrucomicrobia bacterium]|nr:PCRF domain-containing protein [Verrucomicrobiota bacterium]
MPPLSPVDPTAQLARLESRLTELDREMADPDLYRQGTRARDLAREHARIRSGTEAARRLVSLASRLKENAALLASSGDPEMRQMAEEEAAELTRDEAAAKAEVLRSILPPDPDEHRDTIVEIRAGAGGTEAAIFAADLFRMYSRYAETRGWKLEPLSSSPSELGGLKEVVFEVSGQAVFAAMRQESGVHRVQRVPATEA